MLLNYCENIVNVILFMREREKEKGGGGGGVRANRIDLPNVTTIMDGTAYIFGNAFQSFTLLALYFNLILQEYRWSCPNLSLFSI